MEGLAVNGLASVLLGLGCGASRKGTCSSGVLADHVVLDVGNGRYEMTIDLPSVLGFLELQLTNYR